MPDTPLLGLPMMAAAQAQKHVTHNEALLLLDGAIQLSVASRTITAPPGAAAEGERYLVPAQATGAWAAQAGRIALSQGGGWAFLSPRRGWRMWVEAEAKLLVFDGAGWRDPLDVSELANLARLGVNARADETNRLAVSSNAALFSHAGNDHRLKINKNATPDTASLLYQTGFAGRAEMGLTGSDDFRINVSADGASWKQAVVIDRATGAVAMPNTAPQVLFAQSLAAQGPGFAADTYLQGSAIALGAGRLKAGTRYAAVFDVSKTAAGAAAPAITLRFGGSGSLADAALGQILFPAQTAATDDGRFMLEATFRSAGTGAVIQAVCGMTHSLNSGGFSTAASPVRRVTSAVFDAGLAVGVIGLSLSGGAGAAWTVPLVQARLENLA